MYIPKADLGYGFNNTTLPPKRIVIFSGAGISQPSGIQTFRDSDGLWENHKIDEVCNINTWKNNFELVHEFYNQRREQLKNVEPNAAHFMVAEIVEKYGKDNVYNITQNIDDLFERAGCKEDEIMHVHGNLTKLHCQACGEIWDIGYSKFNTEIDRCPKCNSLKGVKPKIIFFGESAPMYSYMYRAFEYLKNPDSIFIIIGTMGNVVTLTAPLKNKCTTILNNMEPSDYLPETLFTKTYFESCITAVEKIKEDVENFIKTSESR